MRRLHIGDISLEIMAAINLISKLFAELEQGDMTKKHLKICDNDISDDIIDTRQKKTTLQLSSCPM